MPHFYKYVTHKTGGIVLQNGALRWSTSGALNDLYELKARFQLDVDWGIAKEMALQKMVRYHTGEFWSGPTNELGVALRFFSGLGLRFDDDEFQRESADAMEESNTRLREKLLPELNEALHAAIRKDKILCLSEIPDQMLMWSHYAENHAGMVLRFTDQPDMSAFRMARPVRYLAQMPSLFDNETISDMLAGYGHITAERLIEDLVWTKSQDWVYEREWRIWFPSRDTDPHLNDPYEDAPFYPAELDGVIFGTRMSGEDRASVTSLVRSRYPWAELFQAKAQPDTYGLVIEPASLSAGQDGDGDEGKASGQ